jgi:hypothetical protein
VTFLLLAVFLLQPLARAEAASANTEQAPSEAMTGLSAEETSIQVPSVDIPVPPSPGVDIDPSVSLDSQNSPQDPTVVATTEAQTPSPEPSWPDEQRNQTTQTVPGLAVVPQSSTSSVFGELPDEGVSTSADSGTQNGPDSGSSESVGEDTSTTTTTQAAEEPGFVVSGSAPSSTPSSDLSPGSTTTLASTFAELATTTTDLPLIHETYSDAEVRFLKQDCVVVEGGAYYCHERVPRSLVRDALISEPDSTGDLEIFLVKDGDYHQLTHNDVDDAAPMYDGRSQTMVWHRLLSNTYVLYEFDFETGIERALTDGLHTDMQPTRFGDRTVWQRWINDYWQVMLLDGEVEVQLTSASAHHLAPVVRGDVVLWQVVDGSGEKKIETLDLLTGVYQTIEDPESAVFTNPRMMMVYEAVYDNGDVVTRGYDLKTGQVVALDAMPTELPDEIPESDSTGETRALINAKSTQKEAEGEALDTDIPPSEPTTPTTTEAYAATTTDMVLDLRTGIHDTSTITAPTLSLEPGDLILAPLQTSTTTE